MLKIHKEILTDGSYVPSFTLRLQVMSTDGDLTPCIFVHQYVPKNPMTKKVSYDFQSVAYYDELTEVKDYVEDKKHVGLVRKSCVEKSFVCREDLDSFMTTVLHDIQRLLTQISSRKTEQCEELTITDSSIVSVPVDCGEESDKDCNESVDTPETESIVLSFDGKITK